MEDEKLLFKKASRRAGFKIHLAIFILVNLFLALFWFFVLKGRPEDGTAQALSQGVLFIFLAWLIIITAHYLFVYKWNKNLIEKELIKLKKENKEREEELERLKKEAEENNEEIND